VPSGMYSRVTPHSGPAVKYFIDVGAGVIYEGYRGSLSIMLFNHSDIPFKAKLGERGIQFICEKIIHPNIVEVYTLKRNCPG